jgi:hypothetical protein
MIKASMRRPVKRQLGVVSGGDARLGLSLRADYDGKNGPPGHPNLKGFWEKWPLVFFWLRDGRVDGDIFHVGFAARRLFLSSLLPHD